MSSAFPGMDPYLESPVLWRGVHHAFITEMMGALNATLPRGYVASVDERVYVIPPQQAIYPDLPLVYEDGQGRPAPASQRKSSAAVAEPEAAPTGVIAAYPEEVREGYIDVRTTGPDGKVVAAIELLSLTNKAFATKAWNEYHTKQEELLRSDVNLLEIDLLRGGTHAIAVPEGRPRERGPWDYLTCLRRPKQRFHFECSLISLRQRLPTIQVPLQHPDPDARLDLQAVLERVYEIARLGDRIDYGSSPIPPLNPDEAAWAAALSREKGAIQ